jgi:hypothetical protein
MMNSYAHVMRLIDDFRQDLLFYMEGMRHRSLERQADHDKANGELKPVYPVRRPVNNGKRP